MHNKFGLQLSLFSSSVH